MSMRRVIIGDIAIMEEKIGESAKYCAACPDGTTNTIFTINGNIVRIDFTRPDGAKETRHMQFGELHRDDGGPALIIEGNGLLILHWFCMGARHRAGKPAIIEYVDKKSYTAFYEHGVRKFFTCNSANVSIRPRSHWQM